MKPRCTWLARFALTLAALVALAGCATGGVYAERDSKLIGAAYDAVDALLGMQQRGPMIVTNGNRRVLVATVVELNRLDRSSPFGRLLAEQMASRLAQLGVPVSELKLRGSLFVSESQGELLLSREVREISRSHSADAVLVGTYVDAGNAVYVTVKLVDATDSTVLAAYNYAINKSPGVNALLERKP